MMDDAVELELGYWIARDYWGRGYATEAAATLKEYRIRELENDRFIALIQSGNKASRRVAERIGAAVEREVLLKGQEVLVYALSS